ncbi:uncharacterized protein LOC144108540 [Amblyomma americanum]
MSGESSASSSSAAANLNEDGAHVFSSTRGLSQIPKLHNWSPMSLVQLSIVVVALTVAFVVTLVFTLWDKDTRVQEIGDDQLYWGAKEDSVAREAGATADTLSEGVLAVVSGQHHDQRGGDLQKRVVVSSRFTNAPGSSQGLPRSFTHGGVVRWNDGNFGPVRFTFAAMDLSSKQREEGHQHDSARLRDKKASMVEKGVQEGMDEYKRKKRRLERVDRKTYLKNVDVRLLKNN